MTPISRETVSSQIRNQLVGANLERRPGAGGNECPPSASSRRGLRSHAPLCEKRCKDWSRCALWSVEAIVHTWPSISRSCVEPSGDGKIVCCRIFETRRVLELPIFEMAAERATEEEREPRLQRCCSDFTRRSISGISRARPGVSYDCCVRVRKPALIELYGKVLDQLFRSVEFFTLLSAESNQAEVARIVADSCAAHLHIAERVLHPRCCRCSFID